MTALLTADRCPACQIDHDHGPPGWPRCPDHGHYLSVLRGPLKTATAAGGDWVYACPGYDTAPGGRPVTCTYTHTQKEKATMTTAAHEAAALAIRQNQDGWDGRQLAALAQLGMADAPEGTRDVFFHYCQATGLDPFLKQIRLRKDRQRDTATGEWETRWSIETEIDGYRVIAARAAKREGIRFSYGDAQWCNAAGEWLDLWLDDRLPPSGARIKVYKDTAPFEGKVTFREFAKYTKQGQLMAQWAVMPAHMIAKCAEAQALRKAFPNDLQDIRLADDAPSPQPPQVTVVQERRQAPVTGPEQSRENVDAMRGAIGRHLAGRLGVTDVHERSAYVHNLANKQVGDDITDADVRTVYALLTEKEDGEYVIKDISALVELTSPEAEVIEEGEAP